MNSQAMAEAPPKDDTTNRSNGTDPVVAPEEKVQQVGRGEITPSPWNRTIDTKSAAFLAFVANVKEHGIIQPLICRPLPSAFEPARILPVVGRKTPRLELVAGERRWLAAAPAGLANVPVIVRAMTDREALELQAIENEQREDLSPIERAEKYQQLLDQYEKAGMKKEAAIAELCRKLSIGKKAEIGKSTVYEALRLLKLPAPVKEAVSSGKLPASHAGLIAKLPDQVASRVARAIAPGKPVQNYREEEAIEKDTGVRVQYERDQETGLVPFREAKEIVDEELDQLERAAKYEAVAEKFRAMGGTALTWDAARKTAANLISLNDWSGDFRQHVRDLVKGVKDLPQQIMRPVLHEPEKPEMVYRRDELMAALKKAGIKPATNNSGGTSMDDYRRREKARLARERIKKAILAKVIDPIRTAARKRNAKIPWPLFLSTLLNWRSGEICELRGWKHRYNDASKVLAANLARLPENQMPGIVADALIESLTTEHTGSYQPGFVELGAFYGVDVKAIAKSETARLAPSDQKAAPKKKVQTSGKAKSKKRGLTDAARKKLNEAMKARWAARRKAAK